MRLGRSLCLGPARRATMVPSRRCPAYADTPSPWPSIRALGDVSGSKRGTGSIGILQVYVKALEINTYK